MTGVELENAVKAALEEIRPFLQRDAGDIELVEIKDDKHVIVRLLGTCVGCSVNQMTLKSGVELTIKKHAPQIETVTDISGQAQEKSRTVNA